MYRYFFFNNDILLHSQFQNVECNPNSRIYNVVLGIPIPEFKEYRREDFLFQCSNHYPQINSVLLARWCNYWHIKCYFAGPCNSDYNLLGEIDNVNTFYLGEIPEELKINYLVRCKGFASLYGFNINSDSLAIKQALSYGCPIITTRLGNPHETIINGYNGFIVDNAYSLYQSFNSLHLINSKNCYDSVQKYSLDKMAKSFTEAFEEIIRQNAIS